jgi:hypothetical protein
MQRRPLGRRPFSCPICDGPSFSISSRYFIYAYQINRVAPKARKMRQRIFLLTLDRSFDMECIERSI